MEDKETDKETDKQTDEAKAKVGGSEDAGKGDKYETTPVIERARQEREKLEAANKVKEELLNREEAIMARKALGGDTEAGGVKEEKKEETPHEYRTRINKELAEGKTEFGN